MAEDYSIYKIRNDFDLQRGLSDTNQTCVYNGDCHPGNQCVNNTCVSVMTAPLVMPNSSFIPKTQINGDNSLSHGSQCLANSDCKSGFCNRFNCSNKPDDYVFFGTIEKTDTRNRYTNKRG
jgi:hypothetical protein